MGLVSKYKPTWSKDSENCSKKPWAEGADMDCAPDTGVEVW